MAAFSISFCLCPVKRLPLASRLPVVCLAFSLLTTIALSADINLDVGSSRSQVYLGETFVLNVQVNGADDGLPAPDLSALQADVRSLGSQSTSRYSISIINGHVSRENVESRVFEFEIHPRTAGTLALGPITLDVHGHRYSAQGPSVKVVGIEQQNAVIASVQASSQTILVDEPFTITLSVAIAELPEPYARYEPLLPSDPLHMDCPYLSQAEIPGLKTPDLQKTLQALVQQDSREPGLTINEYTAQQTPDFFANPFSFAPGQDPFRPRPIKFKLPRNHVILNRRAYQEYTLALTYTPSQEGNYTFGPITLKGSIIDGVDAAGHAMSRPIFAVGPAVTVRVTPPPETNRPDCFIGSVGRGLTAHAELDTALCKVGDPLTLNLNVTGAISLNNMRPPLLNLQPALTADFRIYDDNVETVSIPGGKRFRFRIRPMREGTLELPPIRVAYFDTTSHSYKIALTDPVPLQVRPNTQIVSDSSDNSTNRSAHTDHLTIQSASSIPAAITVAATGARNHPLLPPIQQLLLLGGSGPVLLFLTWTGFKLWHNRFVLAMAHRRSRALAHAEALLQKAERQEHPNAPDVARAIRSFLEERLNVAGTALTPDEAARLLHTRGVPEALTRSCRDLLAQLDHVMYHPDAGSSEMSGVIHAAMELLPRINQALNHPPKSKEDEA